MLDLNAGGTLTLVGTPSDPSQQLTIEVIARIFPETNAKRKHVVMIKPALMLSDNRTPS